MRILVRLLARIGLSILLTLAAVNCFAGIETNQNTLTGPFSTGANYTTQDSKFSDPNWSTYKTNSIQGTVALKLLDNVLISSSFTYTVNIQIQYYTSPTSTVSTINTALMVSYVPGEGAKYYGLAVDKVAYAYKIIVTVTGTSSTGTVPASSVQLNTAIIIDRTYPFTAATGVGAAYAIANNNRQLGVSWAAIPSANEYDVEWTTINDGNSNFAEISAHATEPVSSGDTALSNALARAFVNNASRTTTNTTSVSLSMLSTDSIMLVRVRQAQYSRTTGVRMAGNWDYTNGTVYAVWRLSWDEQNQNWQYSAAFAENGKKKEVISYFDGTLRGRQTVTLDNTDNVSIAQENIYDQFGRPTASILPAPYKEPSLVPYLHYITGFNLNPSGQPYTFANVIGTVPATCELNPDALNTSAGASRYYSGSNDFLTLNTYNNYIPNAEGYPLSVTQYTNDNTGRIESQGGVGLTFQPGKTDSPLLSHTTKYYYGKPEQWELDQLFANDAGYAEHYLKNMVVDPNGQVSISYLNASGKTVATALTGAAPSMLDTLPSYHSAIGSTTPQNIHILKPGQFTYDNSAQTISATTTYLASVIGTDTLKFNIQRLIDKYPGTFPICSNCYYKMTAVVSDNCGNVTAGITTPVKIGDTVGTCADSSLYTGSLVVPVTAIGEYNINIQFAFDNNIIQTYANTFITAGLANGYIQDQFDYIKQRYLDSLNVTGCFNDCHTCTTLLGGQTQFVQMLVLKCTALGLDSASVAGTAFSTWANGLYISLQDSCNALQATCSYSPCTSIQNEMEDDISPGGQYALFDSNENPLEPDINVLSETLPGAGHPNWRVVFPVLPATSPIYISNQFVLPDSTITSPNDTTFTLQKLVTYWQPAWAVNFLLYDPEYCKLKYCIDNQVYESWDLRVQQDFTKASQVPSIPTGSTPLTYSYTNASDWLLPADPFFKTGGPGQTYYAQMDSDLLSYSKNVLNMGTPVKGLMQYDDYELYCVDKAGNTNTGLPVDSNWTQCTPVNSCRVADREWAMYSQYYFQLKQKYYTLLQNAACGSSYCPVGQPVASNLPGTCPLASEFSVQLYAGTPTCTGSQTAVVVHNPGTLGLLMTVLLYYPSSYNSRTDLTRSVVVNAGASQQTFCVPSDVPVSAIGISAVYCGSAPTYGNNPSYVVHLFDHPGGNDPKCSNASFYYPRTTTLTLEDAYGNPVNAISTITVAVTYNITDCYGKQNPFQVNIYIAPTQSTGYLDYSSPADCSNGCAGPQTTALSCVNSLTNASHITGLAVCSGYTVSNPQPPVNPCPAAYATKISRFPTITQTAAGELPPGTDSASLVGPGVAAIQQQAAAFCAGNASAWIAQLQPGLTALPATPAQINQLTSAFIAICSNSGDQNHPMGATTLPPGQTSPYVSFGAAIQSILLGGGHFTSLLNPWLIDNPYPYSPPQQSVSSTISNSNAVLCDSLSSLSVKAAAAGKTLYNYLVSTYGAAMTLSQADLDTLQNSCTSCKFIMAGSVTLPVFLQPGSQGCVLRSAYTAALSAMNTQFGGTLSTSDPNYPTILTNYMNQLWGFSLIYDNYMAFANGSAPQLCNTLPYATVNADPYDCVENAVSAAVSNGLNDYNNYLALQRQNFIASYTSTCSLAQANANLVAPQLEYHYTLYYYDQADNLVRTVPPQGVSLVNPAFFSYIDQARDLDTAAYSYSYNGPETASSLPAALTTLSNTLSAATGSVEMWLYNNSLSNYHWVVTTPDYAYIFQVGIAGSKLNIDVFPLQQPGATSVKLVPSTGHYQADITSKLPLLPFTHVVFQGSSLGTGSSLPQIYLNGTALTVTTTGTPTPVGFSLISTATSVTVPDSIGSLKHLRLYSHLLTQATITADANNIFFTAADVAYTGWYRFNVPAPGTPPTTISATTSDETSVFDMYPAHNLPTTYTYNSTNQATRQLSPDGGTVRYWYDMLSRLVISENAQQYTANNYSYTLYDAIGRISEVGQKNYTGTSIGTPGFLSSSTITAFNAAGTNSQITDTYYDAPVPTVSGNANGIATLPGQGNLRKRVAASTYTETQGSPALRATYYNYDIEGNVKTLWQQVDGLYVNSSNTGLKRIDYEYDLVSGKVNMVRYQDNLADRFYYQYNYDADNRITDAMSGTNDITDTLTGSSLTANNQRLDAHYAYYLHGPLARMELGDVNAKVQGVDYAYTLQGWLKGVNSAAVQSSRDMGHDSIPVARDSYGYALYYYGNGSSVNDYTPVNSSVTAPFSTLFPGLSTFSSLYNGNIAAVTMNIPKLTDPWHLYTYKYDQLNRIRASSVYKVSSTATPVSDYHETFNYDENGNITVASRYAGAATIMDSLTYRYNTSGGVQASNQLNRINDAVTTHTWPYGLDNQALNNYTYDYNGSMTADVRDTISNVNWTVYGKLQNLVNSKGTISYTYNPAGERVSETANGVTTWYIHDAQGNQLAVYDNTHSVTNWREQDLYGSSRLGMWQPNIRVGTDSIIAKWDSIGKKAYELSNHLGNVLTTITDKRLQTASGSSISYFGADVATAQEYYAFGGLMPGRTFTQLSNYRYGFNGKENDNAVKGTGNQIDYGMRIYDPRRAGFGSVDPLAQSYPYYSPYIFSDNNPIKFMDINGLEEHDPVPESYINPKLMIDMTNAPGSNLNSAGYVRNAQWFWRQELKVHPEMFSEDNKNRILKERASPIIDEQWVKYNPTQGAFMEETLVHHHFEQGNFATPLPESVHKNWFRALHEVNPGGRTLSNELKNLHEGFSWIFLLYDLTSDNPQALNMQFRAGEKLNTLYYDMDTKAYFSVTNRMVNKDSKGNTISTTVTYDEFEDYDIVKGKYVGVGKISTYQATKDEKTGKISQQEMINQ